MTFLVPISLLVFDTILQEARVYAEENGLFFMETSAKTASNVNDIFYEIGLVPFLFCRSLYFLYLLIEWLGRKLRVHECLLCAFALADSYLVL